MSKLPADHGSTQTIDMSVIPRFAQAAMKSGCARTIPSICKNCSSWIIGRAVARNSFDVMAASGSETVSRHRPGASPRNTFARASRGPGLPAEKSVKAARGGSFSSIVSNRNAGPKSGDALMIPITARISAAVSGSSGWRRTLIPAEAGEAWIRSSMRISC